MKSLPINRAERRFGAAGSPRPACAPALAFACALVVSGALAVPCAITVSCAWAPKFMAVTVRLPDYPPCWEGADAWIVSVDEGFGAETAFRAGPGESVVLMLPRTGTAFVSCRAAFGSFLGKPYGALWPMQAESAGPGCSAFTLQPGAAGGWTLELARRLFSPDYDLSRFDYARLVRELEGRLPDPWALPPGKLAAPVLEGRFRLDYLREPPGVEAVLSGLPEGLRGRTLIPESPWAPVLAVSADGNAAVRLHTEPRRWFLGSYTLVAGLSPEGAPSGAPSGEPSWTLSSR